MHMSYVIEQLLLKEPGPGSQSRIHENNTIQYCVQAYAQLQNQAGPYAQHVKWKANSVGGFAGGLAG